jgi:hypothetical protein
MAGAGMKPGLPGHARQGRSKHHSMIPKKLAPDVIRGGNRFSKKIMLQQRNRAG